MRYPWLDSIAALNRAYLTEDYRAATTSVPVEAMVFVQCDAKQKTFEQEVEWLEGQVNLDSRIRGMVAWAPLEIGNEVSEYLVRLKRHQLVRGIRRIIQFEPDLDFCLQPEFIAGVRALSEFDFSFDMCIDHRQMGNAIRLVEKINAVPIILDHIGKPAIREGRRAEWASELRVLSRFPNVVCKISGVATEADHSNWTPEDLQPYLIEVITAFGFDRVMFGSDWPVSTQAIRFDEWVAILDRLLAGVSVTDQRKFWRDNAVRVYRLDGHVPKFSMST